MGIECTQPPGKINLFPEKITLVEQGISELKQVKKHPQGKFNEKLNGLAKSQPLEHPDTQSDPAIAAV